MADLTKKIMRRIYFIWFVRQIFNAVTVKVALVFLLAWQITSYVSVKNVIANWYLTEWGFSGSYAFLQSALIETDVMVQVLMLGTVLVASLLFRDVLARKQFIERGRLFIRV